MERNKAIDVMKGIGILTVIAGHSTTNDIIWKIIYSFHMPMFFIIGGFLFTPNPDIKKKIVNDARRLLIPYFFTCIIWTISILSFSDNRFQAFIFTLKATFFASGANHSSLFFPNVPKIGAIWFLFALFWCRIIYNYIFTNYTHSTIIIFSIALIATYIDFYIINLPFALLPGLSAMTFYLIGNFIRYHSISTIQIFICGICWILHLYFFNISMCTCEYGFYPIDVLGATFGAIVIWQLSKIIYKKKHNQHIIKLGQYSLVILCCHTLEKNLIDFNCIMQDVHWIIIMLTESFLCILMTILWNRIYRIIKISFLEYV